MATLSLRIADDDLARFDAWAGGLGGRPAALRHLMADACATPTERAERLPPRPHKLTVRLTGDDAQGLVQAAQAMRLTPNAWAAALIRHRLNGRPTFARSDETALIAIQTDYRRIGVNVNQIARAVNTAVLEGRVLDLELAYLRDLCTELRVHLSTLQQAFAGNAVYWSDAP